MIRFRRPRSWVDLARRLAAGLLALGALVLALRPVPTGGDAAPRPGVAVVVAARDLPGGALLTAADLRTADLLPGTVPAGASVSPGDLVGRSLAGAVRAGEPVTDVRVVGPGLTAALPPGRVAAPVRLADLAVSGLLAAGDRVDVLATAAGAREAEVVAAGALVLAPGPPSGEGPPGPAAGLLLLEVDPPTAARLAAAAASDTLTVTLAPPGAPPVARPRAGVGG